MKTVILSLFVIGLVGVHCRPQPQLGFITKTVPQIINYSYDNFLKGFAFNVDTSDEFHHDAKGEVVSDTGKEEDAGLEVEGSYSYRGDDGKLYRVDYTAGKEGFRPSGEHLVPSAGVKKLGVGASCIASASGCGLG